MPKITTLESFGVSFGIMTEKFLTSGLELFEMECETVGEAINLRMRFNQYWKVLRTLPEDKVPPGLRPFLPELGQLSILHEKNARKIVLTTKDERKMDKKIIGHMAKMDQLLSNNRAMKVPEAAAAIKTADDVISESLKLKVD